MYVSGVQEVLGQVKSARWGQVRMLFKLQDMGLLDVKLNLPVVARYECFLKTSRLGIIRREVKSARWGQVRMLFKLQDCIRREVNKIKILSIFFFDLLFIKWILFFWFDPDPP